LASWFPENDTEKQRGLKKFERATMTRIGRYQIKSRQLCWQCFLPARQSRPAQVSPKLKQRLYPNAAWSTKFFWQRIGDQIDSTSIFTGGGNPSMASRVALASGVAAAAESLERPRQSQ